MTSISMLARYFRSEASFVPQDCSFATTCLTVTQGFSGIHICSIDGQVKANVDTKGCVAESQSFTSESTGISIPTSGELAAVEESTGWDPDIE